MRRGVAIALLIAGSAAPLAGQDAVDKEIRDLREAYEGFFNATPPDVGDQDTLPGVQAGGIEIRIVVPGETKVLVQGDDSDDPRDFPPPEPVGEEICPTKNVRGQLEPVQGVWQDDPTFADKPGKQIVRLSPILWGAELPMVTGRKSLLFGIQRAQGAEPRRNEIFIKGEATGMERVPVKLRFTLKQPGRETVLYTDEELFEVPIGAPCRPDAAIPFEYTTDATNGIPPPDAAFTFEDGEYLIEAELITEDGRGTGIKVGVAGRSVTTHAPSLAFRIVGILGSTLDEQFRPELEEKALTLATLSGLRIPDYLPVRTERLKRRLFPLVDRSDLLNVFARHPSFRELRSSGGEGFLEKAIREELLREMQVGGLMSGYDRLVILMSAGDLRLLWAGSFQEDADANAAAFAASQKVVLVNLDSYGTPTTVAHELIHTFPYIFTAPQMVAECGIDYHNQASLRVAHGHRVTYALKDFRERLDNSRAIMGPAYTTSWITQCSYRHVLDYLSRGTPDPSVILVQGVVARSDEGAEGLLFPFYDLEGIEDLPPDGPGDWAIVLRDAAGSVLSRHAWEPLWELPDTGIERDLVAFAFRLERPAELAQVELEGPGGVLATRTLTSSAPEVMIVAPAPGLPTRYEDGGVRVEWTGSDPDGDPLLYTVLYSPDRGETWMDVALETEASSIVVPLDPEAPADAHRVLVRATDGGRSADAMMALRPAP